MATQKRPDYLPDWATSPSSGGDIVRPDASRRADGWNATEKPPAPWMNWLQNLAYQWIKHVQRLPLLNVSIRDLGDPGGGDYNGLYCATLTKTKQNVSSEYLDYMLWGRVTNFQDSDRSLQIFISVSEQDIGWSAAASLPSIGGGTGRSILDIDATKPTEILAAVEVDNVLQVWKAASTVYVSTTFTNLTLPGSYDVGTYAETSALRKGARIYRAGASDYAFVFSRAETSHFLRSTSATVTAFTQIELYDSIPYVGLWSPSGSPDTIVYVDEAGTIGKTTNAGSTWPEVLAAPGSTPDCVDLAGNADGSLLICVRGDDVYYSNDAGDNWTEASALYATTTAFRAPAEQWSTCAVEGSVGVVIRGLEGGQVFATFDHGATWEYVCALETDIAKAVADSDSTIRSAKILNGRLVYTHGGREYFLTLKC